MKKNLGKIIYTLLILSLPLSATQLATYSLHANKTNAVIKEVLVITFAAHQEDHTDNMFFFLNPKKSDDYKIHLLKKTTDDSKKHNTTTTFEYILFPLKAKKITVAFDFIIQSASDAAVAQSYVDDHDDSVAIQTKSTHISIDPITLDIHPLKHNVDLVGDFILKTKCDTQTITQYDDVNLQYTLKGNGFLIEKKALLPHLKNVHTFLEVQNTHHQLTRNGYQSTMVYTYALSSRQNFSIPSLTLEAYSPTKKLYYTLKTPSYTIKVKTIDAKKLLDAKEAPLSHTFFSFEFLWKIFTYIFVFIMGFFSAKLAPAGLYKKHFDPLADIKNTKTPKKLLTILLTRYNSSVTSPYIHKLEKMIYEKKTKNWKILKKEILKKLEKK